MWRTMPTRCSTPTRASSTQLSRKCVPLPMARGLNAPFSRLISMHRLFPTSTNGGPYPTPGRIVKINLGAGAALPTRIGALDLEDGERSPSVGVAYEGFAYYGFSYGSNYKIVAVNMGIGAALPTRADEVDLLPQEGPMANGAAQCQ